MRMFLCLMVLAKIASAEGFTLESSDIGGQLAYEQVFNSFGCTGKNISPELHWSDAPKGTKSFALTMYDPDAPTGSGWWHWVVFNIPANITALPKGAGNPEKKSMPAQAVQSITNYGSAGYGGACPPEGSGAHRYIFTLHALDTEKLSLKASSMPALVGYMINSHTIEKSSLMAYYKR